MCKKLTRIVIEDHTLRVIEANCFMGSGLKEITVPNSVTALGNFAFSHCAALKHVVFEDGSRLKSIGTSCFVGAGVEEINIPCGVMAVEKEAFRNCKNLKRVIFQCTNTL